MKMEKMHIVPHSHWDREWYMSFSKHRYRLVKLIDDVLEELEKGNFPYYQMDGQFVPIEDYLEIRPQNRERIERLVQEGKLCIGPWYVLQDEYLIGGEANVRNLTYGIEESKKFGKVAMIGHIPDAFGNISQMPQILQGFGIDNAVFGRGITPTLYGCDTLPEYKESASELKWTAPDGSSVIGVQMTCWYDNARELPADKEKLKAKLDRLMEVMSKVQATPYYLGMNGCDHQPLQKDLPKVVKLANELGYPLEISNLERYVESVRPYADSFYEVFGELNAQKTCGYGTMKNTASARVYMKQLNYKAEYTLNGLLEPLYALSKMSGGKYDQDLLDYAWKTLLKNYPHDSICCCSIDQVIRDMEGRFHAVIDTCEMAIDDLSTQFVSNQSVFNACKYIVVYNVSPFATTEWVETELMFNADESGYEFHLTDLAGNEVFFEELSRATKKVYELPNDSFRIVHEKCVVKIKALVSMDGFGYKVLRIVDGKMISKPAICYENGQIETEYIILTINQNGSFNLLDKRNNRMYKNQNLYEYMGDIGNEYNTVEFGTAITNENCVAQVEVTVNGLTAEIKIVTEMEIPKSYDKETNVFVGKENLRIETILTVASDSPMVKINTRFMNVCENYRLRALFPYDCQKTSCTADTPFDMIERSLILEKEWENPHNSERMNAFVEYADEYGGVAVSGRGLHEYEVYKEDKMLGITLFRAVGEMGDWFYFPTPEAQCKGEANVTYAFIPMLKENEAGDILSLYKFYKPSLYAQPCAMIKESLCDTSFFCFEREGIVNCSAIKCSKDGEGIIVRVYNPSNEKVTLKINGSKSYRIFSCNLDESIVSEICDKEICLDTKKIVTLKMIKKSETRNKKRSKCSLSPALR